MYERPIYKVKNFLKVHIGVCCQVFEVESKKTETEKK